MRRFFVLVFVIALILGLTACGGDEPEAEPTAAPTATAMPEPTAAPAQEQTDDSAAANIVFTIDPARSTARYLIREQLASVTSPSDAIGETMDVTGTIVLDAEGNVVSEESQIVVGLAGLSSDSSQARQLRQAKYPADGPVP